MNGHYAPQVRALVLCRCGKKVPMLVRVWMMGARMKVGLLVDDLQGHDCGEVKKGDILGYGRYVVATADIEDPATPPPERQSNLTWF